MNKNEKSNFFESKLYNKSILILTLSLVGIPIAIILMLIKLIMTPKQKTSDEHLTKQQTISYNYKKQLTFVEEFIAFHVETTGLSPLEDEIIQIAAVHFKNGEICNIYSTYVKPLNKIPNKITKINGITNEIVKDSPSLSEVIPIFIKFISNHVLVTHNASFDMRFILNAIHKHNLKMDNKIVDTLSLSRHFFPSSKNHKLSTLVDELQLGEFKFLDALMDSKATGYLYLKCKSQNDIASSKIIKNTVVDNHTINELELKCLENVKSILTKHARDISYLRYNHTGQYFDIKAFYSLVRLKLQGRKQYILTKHTEEEINKVSNEFICEKAVKSETGITRILFSDPNQLFLLEEIIVNDFDCCMKDMEYYVQNVACGESNLQSYLDA
ncbi:exonuclease domain-containing protein [Vallitalea guaymasensis]|uniref:exonuclease domain-containing protein n=1 Tax=Vallitalea guaymasensis TaxID=1185412 RepID=UPI002353570B|nr:exonuclease domain-containing protein [Vallitalea guaymasensis]